MDSNKADYYSLRDVFSHFTAFLLYLKKRIGLIIVFAILGGVFGFIYYKVQKPQYEAVTTFILEEKSAGGGGLAGLASQFGFDLGGLSGGGSIFTGDNILDILRSKKIVHKVLLSKVDAQTNNVTLADLFLDFSGWKEKWASNIHLDTIKFINTSGDMSLSPVQDSVLNEIYEYVLKQGLSAERLNKKGSIIRVQVTSTNSVFAKLMTERLVDAAAAMYLELKTGTAQANISKLQSRSDSLLILLNRKSFAAAASQPLDINPGIKAAIVPVEIATRDKTVLATLYAEVTKNLEASKLLLSQQTPVIQMLDRPGYSLDDNRKKLLFLLVVSPIVSVLLYILFAFPLFLLSNKNGQKS